MWIVYLILQHFCWGRPHLTPVPFMLFSICWLHLTPTSVHSMTTANSKMPRISHGSILQVTKTLSLFHLWMRRLLLMTEVCFIYCWSCDINVRGTLKFQYSNSATHVTLCNSHPLITQYMSHIVYPYHIVPLSISVPCYCHPTPFPSCFTYYFQYFLYFIFSPYLSSVIHCWLLCTLFLM